LISGIVSHVFVACQQKTASRQQVVRFWAMGAEGEAVQKLKPIFERQHPSIKLDIQTIPWTAAQEKLISAYASRNLPDVFQLGNTWIPQFAALNTLEALNTRIDTSRSISSAAYFRGIWQTNIIDSLVYGIPWYIDTRVLFYRTDLLKQAGFTRPPRTWQALYTMAKAIKKQSRSGQYALYLPTNEWAPFVIFGLQNGASLLKENSTRGNFESPAFLRAFEFLIRFYHEDLAPLGFTQITNVYQAFARGTFVFYISGPWNLPQFKRWMSDSLRDRWMTAPLPAPHADTIGCSLAGGSSLVLNRHSPRKQAAWTFIEFLSLAQTQVKFYELMNDLPARKAAWKDPHLKEDPYLRAFYQQLHHVKPLPKIPEWEHIAFAKIRQYVEYAARNKMSSRQALRALDRDTDKILEKRRWLLKRQHANSGEKP